MSQIMKSFMGVFIMLFMSVTSIGILSGFLSVLSVQDLHSCIISELEDSDFYEEMYFKIIYRNIASAKKYKFRNVAL